MKHGEKYLRKVLVTGRQATTVMIQQDPEKPIERNVMAKAIIEISDAMNALLRSGLTRRAIVVLVHDATKGKVGKPAIEDVLSALETLKQRYTR